MKKEQEEGEEEQIERRRDWKNRERRSEITEQRVGRSG